MTVSSPITPARTRVSRGVKKQTRLCCKNEADIAEAIGLKLYATSRSSLRRNQLAAVKTLIEGAHHFPAKRPYGKRMLWDRSEIIKWASTNVIVSDNCRFIELFSEARTAGGAYQANGGSPVQPTEDERERILKSLPHDYATRLRALYEKWCNPNDKENKALTKSERDELLASGIVRELKPALNGLARSSPAPVDLPDYCSQSEFAKLMAELFNVFVSPQMVSVAINREGMPGKMTNGSVKVSMALKWWESNKVLKPSDIQGNLFQQAQAAEHQAKIDNGRRIRLELEELERSTSNKWIELSVLENFMEGRGLKDCDATDRLIEDKKGLRPIVLNAVKEWLAPVLATLNPQLSTLNYEILDARIAEEFRAANDDLKKQFLASLTELNQKTADAVENKKL